MVLDILDTDVHFDQLLPYHIHLLKWVILQDEILPANYHHKYHQRSCSQLGEIGCKEWSNSQDIEDPAIRIA